MQIIFWVLDMGLIIPAMVIVFDTDFIWFILLDGEKGSGVCPRGAVPPMLVSTLTPLNQTLPVLSALPVV